MKRTGTIISVLLIAVAAVAIGYWGWGRKKTEQEAMSVADAAKTTMVVVNVLDKALFDDAHIKGSIQIAEDKLAEESDKWAKDTTVVFYCSNAMCTASSKAAEMLMAKGFTNVSAFEGGMAEWFQLSKTSPEYAVEGPATAEYLAMQVQKPTEEPTAPASPVKKITAVELLNLMKSANLLA